VAIGSSRIDCIDEEWWRDPFWEVDTEDDESDSDDDDFIF
jgi:hypothetical protein